MDSKINIIQTVTGSYMVNTYLVSCPETREGFIVDPGGDAEKIKKLVTDNNIQVKYILNTHGHADHVLANMELKHSFKTRICMHKDDADFFIQPEIQKISEKELGLAASGSVDIKLGDGDLLKVGCLEIRVLHTPGHSPGSACFLVKGNLFTGDTLFVGDVGRSDLVGGSFDTLLQSIKEQIIVLPRDTIVWPGHNYGETPTSTLAWEMAENPYITDFILAEE